ncbi:hypothetical protein QQ045_022543 [Rhodiola kirilowii]
MTGLGSSCGACKYLRRKCAAECIFAPYFCYDQAAIHFSAVHKVFGASNVSKLLLHLPIHNRSVAAMTVTYEALARMKDPIYGCVIHLEKEIELLEKQMAAAWFHSTSGYSVASPNSSNNFCGLHVEVELDFDVPGLLNAQQTPLLFTEATDQTCQRLWEDKTWFPSLDPMDDDQDIFMHCAAEKFGWDLNCQAVPGWELGCNF